MKSLDEKIKMFLTSKAEIDKIGQLSCSCLSSYVFYCLSCSFLFSFVTLCLKRASGDRDTVILE